MTKLILIAYLVFNLYNVERSCAGSYCGSCTYQSKILQCKIASPTGGCYIECKPFSGCDSNCYGKL